MKELTNSQKHMIETLENLIEKIKIGKGIEDNIGANFYIQETTKNILNEESIKHVINIYEFKKVNSNE